MGLNRPHRRIAAWLACLSVLLAALAPSISHAVLATDSNPSSIPLLSLSVLASDALPDICRSAGGHDADPHLQTGSDDPDVNDLHASHGPDDSAMHFEHCPFCLTHAASFGLLPSPAVSIALATGSSPMPALFYQSPHPQFIWTSAQSRAPPVIS